MGGVEERTEEEILVGMKTKLQHVLMNQPNFPYFLRALRGELDNSSDLLYGQNLDVNGRNITWCRSSRREVAEVEHW